MDSNQHVIFSLILGTLFLLGGVFYYSHVEGWSYVDAFYFSTMSLTTVGYGDLVPTTDGSKIFTSIYSIFGIGVMLYLLGSVVSTFLFNQEKYIENLLLRFHKKKEIETKIKKGKKLSKTKSKK